MTAWPSVRLGDVLRLADRSVPVNDLAEVNVAGVYSFGRGLFKRGPLTPSETSYRYFNRLMADDFVISQPKAWEGALARVPAGFDGWYLSPVFPAFRADASRLLSRWLEWYCKRSDVWFELKQLAKGLGARRETVSPEQFLSLEIPLPSLSEQQRLVARVDAVSKLLDQGLRLNSQSVAEATLLARAGRDAVYARLAAWYGVVDVASLCRSITDGDHNTPAFSEEGVPFVFVGNVSSSKLHFEGSKRVHPEYFARLSTSRVPKRGDVLFSAVGASLGVPAVVDTDTDFCFQRHIAILKPDHDRVVPQFLWHMLMSRTCFEMTWKTTTGSAQPTIPLHAIRALKIPRPPLDEQHRIVAELDALQAEVDALKVAQAASRAELDALLPAVLDCAFAGAL